MKSAMNLPSDAAGSPLLWRTSPPHSHDENSGLSIYFKQMEQISRTVSGDCWATARKFCPFQLQAGVNGAISNLDLCSNFKGCFCTCMLYVCAFFCIHFTHLRVFNCKEENFTAQVWIGWPSSIASMEFVQNFSKHGRVHILTIYRHIALSG